MMDYGPKATQVILNQDGINTKEVYSQAVLFLSFFSYQA